MSRSIKLPWVSDQAKSYMKPIHARRMRRKIRQLLNVFRQNEQDYDVGPTLPVDNEVTNPYDICDYKFYWSDPRATRK